ncbi:MAG: GNAT family N-acetyltransferase [Spirochaetia bacterium]|nr:GNAT family N-acetyltransferase [Spirochaetia bacterium]
MDHSFINLDRENIENEHICCAISDKKHQKGVLNKKEWLRERIPEGHIFRKATVRGKVFIEYSPLESAWVPLLGDNYLYIYCLWVSGSYTGQGYAKELLEYCIKDAKREEKSGVCVLSSAKKKPFLSDKKFFLKFGFHSVQKIGEYELLALSFDANEPTFSTSIINPRIGEDNLTIYYDHQCPYIAHQIDEIKEFCETERIPLNLIEVTTLEQAKALPTIFNNWAVWYEKEFKTVHLLNPKSLKKIINHS